MNNNINWEEVEQKVAIICNKFSNIASWREDLAQELRIHAYYVSDNYYDLYRKAIDFWRKLQTRQFPETPYYDLEVLNPSYTKDYNDQFDDIIKLIQKELDRYGNTKWDRDKLEVSKKLLLIIAADIDESYPSDSIENKTNMNHYINSRLNLSWVEKETGINYKRLVNAMKILEDIVQGLAVMHKIDISDEYLEDYYKNPEDSKG